MNRTRKISAYSPDGHAFVCSVGSAANMMRFQHLRRLAAPVPSAGNVDKARVILRLGEQRRAGARVADR